jgi:hypothetical protein
MHDGGPCCPSERLACTAAPQQGQQARTDAHSQTHTVDRPIHGRTQVEFSRHGPSRGSLSALRKTRGLICGDMVDNTCLEPSTTTGDQANPGDRRGPCHRNSSAARPREPASWLYTIRKRHARATVPHHTPLLGGSAVLNRSQEELRGDRIPL